jgi:serine/threonine protein kinase
MSTRTELDVAPARDGLAGRALGDFVVVERLAAGGHGEVWRAEQPALGREAVIKVLRGADDGTHAQRFLREARLASRLDHPYAAHVYAFGAESDGLLWIAMERIRGLSLAELLERQGPLPVERLVPLFERLCEVVQTAHDAGIVHRDLKPANVMVVARAGRLLPKLLDLGIARFADASERAVTADLDADDAPVTVTRAGDLVGSPAFMAPEHASTMRARSAAACAVLRRRASNCSSARSPSLNSSAAFGRASPSLVVHPTVHARTRCASNSSANFSIRTLAAGRRGYCRRHGPFTARAAA